MNLNPKKIDILKDKHFALQSWLKRAEEMLSLDKEKEYLEAVKKITQAANELFLVASTDEEKGKEWHWWS